MLAKEPGFTYRATHQNAPMKNFILILTGILATCHFAQAEIKVTVDHNSNSEATAKFKFKNVPPPAKQDAGAPEMFTLVDGERDENGGELGVLHDGKGPTEEDQPAENFFFNAGTEGGRIQVDLGKVIEVKEVNTYSWHPNTRGPQVYKLYGSDGSSAGFDSKPKKAVDPEKAGWTLIAKVDTHPKDGDEGGQYAVSISNTSGVVGKYRYLLFAISRTEETDLFGNTFYSEIDVIDANAEKNADTTSTESNPPAKETVQTEGYEFTIDTTETPDLTEWAHKEIASMGKEWYPKIVKLLPSDGYEAPKTFSITFSKDMRGVAATGGTRIRCAGEWFRRNLKGEAVGAIFHEMVHVVQQYGRARRANPDAPRAPGWLTEGIPDYIRWFIFEPQSHGAEITRRNISRARYDGSYRITANFLNWVTQTYSKDLVRTLNAAIRDGKYTEELWKESTGHTLVALGDEWKKVVEEKVQAESQVNALTDEETKAGWKLLFNGKDLGGWHNFKREGVLPGWQVKDGTLACLDPQNAKDIVTSEQFEWFELQLDYNISEGGNSGIMYHVTDEANAAWATGPEFQLEDNKEAHDPQRCGWLYGLYEPPMDEKTGKPLDATKPAGQWNHIRLLISPEKCEHDVNGVKYFEYVLGSDDFNARVAKSKFGRMRLFAKASSGYIALQGDHGQVSFRNIKIRSLKAETH